MIVKYDSLNRIETPKFVLCNPGSVYNNGLNTNYVGTLIDHEAEEFVFNFNSPSELNFRVNKVIREDVEDRAYTFYLYKSIQNRRLIFVEDIGYFTIGNVEDGYENGIHYKDVSAKSIDAEIAQKMIPYIEDGTYRFLTDDTGTNSGILEKIVETLPLWTIGYVDSKIANKYRTFEDVDTSKNCHSFLLEDVQEAYECIILFDIVNRKIDVYDQDNYIRKTDIHISENDVISSLNVSESADDLYTAISVLGDENVTISAINPLGTNVIYNFDYYLDWMSDGLRNKVSEWATLVSESKNEYYDLNLEYYKKLSESSTIESEIDKINTQIKMYIRCRNNIVAESSTDLVGSYNTVIINNGGKPIEVYEEIADTLAEIDGLIATCDGQLDSANAQLNDIKTTIEEYRTQIDEFHNRLAINNYFNEEDRSELCHYIYEGSYQDEYVTITDIMSYEEKFEQMKTLYDRAEIRLNKVSKPTQEFSIDTESFIFSKEFEHWTHQLETGCLINVELDTNNTALLFLSSITANYDDKSMSMTFGNRFNKFDPKSLFEDVLGSVSKSANTLSYIKDILYPIKSGEFNAMRDALQSSRSLTMSAALSSDGEQVLIDGSGYTGKKLLNNGSYDPRQVKITGRNLVFTDDAWETCKVAIGELVFGDGETAYGVNAEAIIGDVIIGNNLRIIDDNGNDLLTVVDGKISTSISEVDGRVTSLEQNANGIDIRIKALEDDDGEVDHVTTTNGYKFNSEGLTIYEEGDEITNRLDHTGMYVERSDEDILTANNEGVTAINLLARQYLIVGKNSRFEDYSDDNDTKRTACFYIGG